MDARERFLEECRKRNEASTLEGYSYAAEMRPAVEAFENRLTSLVQVEAA
jgi:hypothetical protein